MIDYLLVFGYGLLEILKAFILSFILVYFLFGKNKKVKKYVGLFSNISIFASISFLVTYIIYRIGLGSI